MIPTDPLGLIVFVAAAGPGFVFRRTAARRVVASPSSSLGEALEMAFVGCMCTAVAGAIIVSSTAVVAWFDPHRLLAGGGSRAYVVENPIRGASVVVGSLVLASAIAYLAARITYRQSATIRPGSVLQRAVAIESLAGNADAYASVELADGRVFHGGIGVFSSDPQAGDDRIGLTAPVTVVPRGGQPQVLPATLVVVDAATATYVAIQYCQRSASSTVAQSTTQDTSHDG